MNAIETEGLTRRYGLIPAVEDVSLAVPVGARYGLLGASGAGKTTTIRLLLGLTRPDTGQVRLFRRDVRRDRSVLGRVGTLVGAPALYPHLTGREHLEVTRRLTGVDRARVPSVLERVGLGGIADRAVRGYSLGMRQRLGLALALLGEPDLLILDEPTNNLDPDGRLWIRELIVALASSGTTVFWSSRLLAEVQQMATHVGILRRGRLMFSGSVANAGSCIHLVIGTRVPGRARRTLADAGWDAVVSGAEQVDVVTADRGLAARVIDQLVDASVPFFEVRMSDTHLRDLLLGLTSDPTEAP